MGKMTKISKREARKLFDEGIDISMRARRTGGERCNMESISVQATHR